MIFLLFIFTFIILHFILDVNIFEHLVFFMLTYPISMYWVNLFNDYFNKGDEEDE